MSYEVKGKRITESCCLQPFCEDENTEAEPITLGISQPWMKLFPDALSASVSSLLVLIVGQDIKFERWIDKHC